MSGNLQEMLEKALKAEKQAELEVKTISDKIATVAGQYTIARKTLEVELLDKRMEDLEISLKTARKIQSDAGDKVIELAEQMGLNEIPTLTTYVKILEKMK